MTAVDAAVEQPAASPPPQRAQAHIASTTPGRLRVRVHQPACHHHLLHTVQERLTDTEGTHSVKVDAHTGSVLVSFDPQIQSHAGLLAILRDLGVMASETARGIDLDVHEVEPSGHSRASEGIVDAVSDLDRQIAKLTGHHVDLKLLFPLTLGAVGVWQLARRGAGLSEVPAYVLLWYAFDSFWKFHRQPARPPEHGAD
jgi:hypothetical protein